jgi:dihydropteroate synthase
LLQSFTDVTKDVYGNLAGVKVGDRFPVRIMGVINLTTDSFYKRSVKTRRNEILGTALKMQEQGADFIDIGARSTAPYTTSEVSETLESRLLSRALRILSGKIRIPLSVDTTRILAAKEALGAGAEILNDPYGFAHEQGIELAKLASDRNVPVIITAHETRARKRGDPVARVCDALAQALKLAKETGINSRKIAVDPGIGFFSDPEISNVEWNSKIIANIQVLRRFQRPILVGVSRKKFLGILGGNIPPSERLAGSLSATAIAVYNGAHVIRTHDVLETKQAIIVASKIREQAAKGLSRIQ